MIEFSLFGLPQMKPKSFLFRILIENVDFAKKLIVFLRENSYFGGSELHQIERKSKQKEGNEISPTPVRHASERHASGNEIVQRIAHLAEARKSAREFRAPLLGA